MIPLYPGKMQNWVLLTHGAKLDNGPEAFRAYVRNVIGEWWGIPKVAFPALSLTWTAIPGPIDTVHLVGDPQDEPPPKAATRVPWWGPMIVGPPPDAIVAQYRRPVWVRVAFAYRGADTKRAGWLQIPMRTIEAGELPQWMLYSVHEPVATASARESMAEGALQDIGEAAGEITKRGVPILLIAGIAIAAGAALYYVHRSTR